MVKFSSVVVLTILAAYASSEDAIDAGGRKFSAIVQMVQSQITTAYDSTTVTKMIQNYGCHCFPGMSRAAGGQGASVDNLDAECRTLYRCHKCVDINFPGSCDVDFGKYKYSIVGSTIDCSANTVPCKMDQCECDKAFAENLGTVWSDSAYNAHYWLNKNNVKAMATAGTPTFDHNTVCVASNTNSFPDMCCGTSSPYDSTARSCCAASSRTYNPMVEDCCLDGSIKAIGSC